MLLGLEKASQEKTVGSQRGSMGQWGQMSYYEYMLGMLGLVE
jgi:hypothetical protein